MRERSGPSCGFEASRDSNAALEIKRLRVQKRGVTELTVEIGQGMTESMSSESLRDSVGIRKSPCDFRTLTETVLPRDIEVITDEGSPKRVAGTGSLCLKKRAAYAVSE